MTNLYSRPGGVDFQNGCLYFNIFAFLAYAFVNFGMAQDGKLKAATAKYQAAREKKQESKVAVAAATDPELPLLPQRTLQLPAEASATVFMEMDDDDSGTLDRAEVAKLLVPPPEHNYHDQN